LGGDGIPGDMGDRHILNSEARGLRKYLKFWKHGNVKEHTAYGWGTYFLELANFLSGISYLATPDIIQA
jgi:hypothetical protein